MAEPSKVIHVLNVGHEISENDLIRLFHSFGFITKLVMFRAKNQALLQMRHISSAIDALQFYENDQPNIRGRNVYVQFYSHQEITKMDERQAREDEVPYVELSLDALSVYTPFFSTSSNKNCNGM